MGFIYFILKNFYVLGAQHGMYEQNNYQNSSIF